MRDEKSKSWHTNRDWLRKQVLQSHNYDIKSINDDTPSHLIDENHTKSTNSDIKSHNYDIKSLNYGKNITLNLWNYGLVCNNRSSCQFRHFNLIIMRLWWWMFIRICQSMTSSRDRNGLPLNQAQMSGKWVEMNEKCRLGALKFCTCCSADKMQYYWTPNSDHVFCSPIFWLNVFSWSHVIALNKTTHFLRVVVNYSERVRANILVGWEAYFINVVF